MANPFPGPTPYLYYAISVASAWAVPFTVHAWFKGETSPITMKHRGVCSLYPSSVLYSLMFTPTQRNSLDIVYIFVYSVLFVLDVIHVMYISTISTVSRKQSYSNTTVIMFSSTMYIINITLHLFHHNYHHG